MEVITDELWIMAVKMAPINTNRMGLLILARKVFTMSCSAKVSIEPLIRESPTKSIPNPVRIPPVVFHLLLLEKSIIKAPKPARAEKSTLVEMEFPPPNIPKATI